MPDPNELFPNSEYVAVPSIPVFKEHRRVKGGRNITVTKKELDAIASNVNRDFDELGVAVPLTLGHTRDGADGSDLPETEQPDIIGWSVNYRTGKLENGEDALYCDWYVQKKHANAIKDYPTRSVEYYVNRQTIWPVALLKASCPELTLPIIKYKYALQSDAGDHYPFLLTHPISYSQTQESQTMNPMDEEKKDYAKDEKPSDKPEDKAKEKASQSESKGAKEDGSKLSDLEAKVNQIMSFLPVLEQLAQMLSEEAPEGGDGDGDKDDLMKPSADKSAPPADQPTEKDEMKKVEGPPVKFESGMPSATNCNIPSYSKKDKYQMNDEVVKYKAMEEQLAKYKLELDATKKIANDLNKEAKLLKAKEMVKELEEVHLIKYASDEVRQQDIALFAKLEPASAKEYFEMAKVRYQKRLPDSDSASKATKYAMTEEPDFTAKTPEEAQERALKAIQSGMTIEEFYKQRAAGKK